ncbi:MAG: hypothetical protein ACPGU1_21115 [Myxococcota bacterium]
MTVDNSKQTVSDLWRQTLGLDSLDELGVDATGAASPDQHAAQLLAALQSSAVKGSPTAQLAQPDTLVATAPEGPAGRDSLNRQVTAWLTFPSGPEDPSAAGSVSAKLPHAPVQSNTQGTPASDANPRPHYRILREVGRGGMGIVYCALQHSLNHEAALPLGLPAVASSMHRMPTRNMSPMRSQYEDEARHRSTDCAPHTGWARRPTPLHDPRADCQPLGAKLLGR